MTVKRLQNDSGLIDAGHKTHKTTPERLENDSTMPSERLPNDYPTTLK
jgi:hypothetical protein